MKILPLLLVVLFFQIQRSFTQQILPLWEGTPPYYQASGEEEVVKMTDVARISNVQTPDIAVYQPSKSMITGEAVIICPGGGYWILAYDKEGIDIAKYFNSKGITAIVLKYRLPVSKSNTGGDKTPLADAQRAMRLARYHAAEWGIDPNKIGIMGFSAGGHLASSLSTHFDSGNAASADSVEQLSCRPDFSLLIYPVITFTQDFMHKGSRTNLLGSETPSEELAKYYSNELQITEATPPAILIHAADDKGVPVNNSIVYFQALQKLGITTEMHIYPNGGHGFGLAINRGYLSEWPDRCVDFIHKVTQDKN
ncbi:MAG: alpha/beta hydrolase [Prolixibacteraceae bacterium]